MRTLPLLLLFAATPTFAATLGARSAHHELRLERNAVSPEQIAYDVTVVDLDSGKAVLNAHLTGKPGEALDAASGTGDHTVRVRLAYSAHFFSATVNVIDGKTIADEFRTWWQLEPQQASLAPPPPPASTLNTAGVLRVGGDVKAPIITYRVEPKYTAEALEKRISGIVILEVIIGKDGRVREAQVLKPLPYGLDQAAVDAVKQWQFRPGTLNGEPVDVLFNLTINFKLDVPQP
jgi:TonB family protein